MTKTRRMHNQGLKYNNCGYDSIEIRAGRQRSNFSFLV